MSYRFVRSVRFGMALLLCAAFTVTFCVAILSSVTMPCLVNSSAIYNKEYEEPQAQYYGSFVWTVNVQTQIHTSYHYGKLLMIGMGYLADKFDQKTLLLYAVGTLTLTTAMVPSATYLGGYGALLIIRFVQGVAHGLRTPLLYKLTSKWFPRHERNRAYTMVTSGNSIATFLVFPLVGLFCAVDVAGGLQGWMYIYIIVAALGVLWLVLWAGLGASNPAVHPYMSNEERMYLTTELGREWLDDTVQRRSSAVPLSSILRSSAVWASFAGIVGRDAALYILVMYMPVYFKDALKVGAMNNSLLNMAPRAIAMAIKLLCGVIADKIVANTGDHRVDTLTSKAFNAIGSLGLGGFCLATTVTHQHSHHLAAWLVVCAFSCSGFHATGPSVTLLNLAPAYSGLLTSIAYFLVDIVVIVVADVIGATIGASGDPVQWNTVFYLVAAISFTQLAVFSIWGVNEEQDWAHSSVSEETSLLKEQVKGAYGSIESDERCNVA